ncbi:ABC transporter ATP-binding protein [Veillonella criceti]|uniref:Probable siderophore transport system ATP-binding protein YusV n=1 Tax=Veillonella criceti TaxID=103891 RepID=A0A380NM29_9FIRM|nr:ABC transporter ATP-binding protein [Veillonella criceti]SUP44446.1 Probable siderophore transport system ATP-binding protein YusV [Veillonella criceti]
MNVLSTTRLAFQDAIFYPDLTIPQGKMTFLQGPSGCGKSTLFHLFNATVNPSRGTIYFKGTDIQTINTLELRQQIILVNQDVFLFGGSIKDNFRTFHQYRKSTAPTDSEMEQYLHIAVAPFTVNQAVTNLSGGEKQRVFNAIMLSLDADIYMWDEPSSALDSATAITFFERLKKHMHTYNKTCLVISHDDGLYPKFSDHLIELKAKEKARKLFHM